MITPVILCGGSGTRLWPVSRKSFPKQFVPLTGRQSLFAASALRLVGPDFAAPLVVTGSDFRFIVAEQMLEAGVDPGAVLIEPDARNTAPAVLAACTGNALLGDTGCATNGLDDFDKIHFWRTPVADCGNGNMDCVPYHEWGTNYIAVIGGR